MFRLLSLLIPITLLSACDEDKEVKDSGKNTVQQTQNASDFRWSEESGTLALNKALNREELKTSSDRSWDLRSVGASPEEGRWGRRTGGLRRYAESSSAVPVTPTLDASRGPAGQQPAGSLRAGATDDNAAFEEYLTYLEAQYQHGDSVGYQHLYVQGRRTVQALAANGAPLPGARVSVIDPVSDRLLWTARTYGDGRAPFYPGLFDQKTAPPEGGWVVQVEHDGVFQTARWDGTGELDVTLDQKTASGAVAVDVCFIIDTTGSMSDEIARIKETLLAVTDKLRRDANQEVALRYGAVLYRDIGDTYLTKQHAFTANINAFDKALQGIEAGGGGDGPESLNQGMAAAMGGMEWREGAAKVAFLIADAPPHMDYQDDVPYGRSALAAIHNGVRVHTVAASGLDDRGSLVFRQIAQLTRGAFIFIEYGSTAAAAADHGVTGPVSSNNLDAILYKHIHEEIIGWGREPIAQR